jgi:hypothetical protein
MCLWLTLGAKKMIYCVAEDHRTLVLWTFLQFILGSSFICIKCKYLKEWEYLKSECLKEDI